MNAADARTRRLPQASVERFPTPARGGSRKKGDDDGPTAANVESLKTLAMSGCLYEFRLVTTKQFGDRLALSMQSASRRMNELDEKGYIERRKGSRGQRVQITTDGREILTREWQDYNRIFNGVKLIRMEGRVVSGEGVGRYYVRRKQYMEQFKKRLQFEPFAGTLNVQVSGDQLTSFSEIKEHDGIVIEPFTNGMRTFGRTLCYRCTVRDLAGRSSEAAVIVPEKTIHLDVVEVISPDNLRETLSLEDDSMVTLTVALDEPLDDE